MATLFDTIQAQATKEFIIEEFESYLGPHKDSGPTSKMFVCPFHTGDKNASLSMDPNKFGMFHCFGCDKKGNLFTLLENFGVSEPMLYLKRKLKINEVSAGPLPPKPKLITAEIPEAKKTVSKDLITTAHNALMGSSHNKERLNKMGISDAVIIKREIGYAGQRFFFPIKDESGDYVNVRKYDPDHKDPSMKVISHSENITVDGIHQRIKGWGKARLYPIDALQQDPIYIFEGEKDMLTAESIGLNAMTVTGGASTWNPEWNELFKGKNVVIVPDVDEPGILGGRKKVTNLITTAKSVKMVYLPLPLAQHPHGDFNDYIIKLKKTLENFMALVAEFKEEGIQEQQQLSETPPAEQPQEEEPEQPKKKDLECIALEIIEKYGLICVPEEGGFYVYSTPKHHWIRVKEEEIKRMITSYLRSHGMKIVVKTVRDVMFFMEANGPAGIDGLKFNRHTHLLNLANGAYNTKTHILEPHEKKHYFTYSVPIDYDDSADCPTWKKAIEDIFPGTGDRKKFLRQMFGYCLTTSTEMQKAFIFYGTGSNGKSVVIKTLKELVGDINYSAVPFAELCKPFSRALLQNKLINIGTEIDYDNETATSSFKEIVTGDPIHADIKYQPQIIFEPFCKMIYATNDLPNVRDKSKGYFRRLVILPFNTLFEGENMDKDILTKILAEKPGILKWSIDGLKEIQADGSFTIPHEAEDLVNEYKMNSNPLFMFISERCTIDMYKKQSKPMFISEFKDWCKANGYKQVSTIRITKMLKESFKIDTTHSGGTYYYDGIEILPLGADVEQPKSNDRF